MIQSGHVKRVLSHQVFLSCLYLGYCALILAPYLSSGYYYDDLLNSLLPGDIALSGRTLGSMIGSFILEWMHNAARFFPLAPTLTMPVHYYLSLSGERILQVGLVVVNIVTFALILLKLENRKTAGLFAIIILALFQARAFYDPITSFGCLLQFLVLFGSLAIYFAVLNLETRRFCWTALSLLTYSCALLLYEEGTVFGVCLGALVILKSKNWKAAFKALLPYIALTSAWIIVLIYLRLTQSTVYPGNRIALTSKILVTFLYQFSGAFPLTYPLFARSGVFTWKNMTGFFQNSTHYLIFTFSLLICGLIVSTFRNPQGPKDQKTNGRVVYALSFILTVISSLLIALSEKYQNELSRPGHSYLPVYIAYFGVALGAARYFSRKLDFSKLKTSFYFVIALSSLTTFNRYTNSVCIAHQNRIFKFPRDTFTELLHAGFLDELPENSKVFLDKFSWWIGKEYFYMTLKKKTEVISLTQHFRDHHISNGNIAFTNDRPVFLKYEYINPNLSWAVLTPIKTASWQTHEINSHPEDELTHAISSSPAVLWVYSAVPLDQLLLRLNSGQTYPLELKNIQPSNKHSHWYRVALSEKNLDLQTIEIIQNSRDTKPAPAKEP